MAEADVPLLVREAGKRRDGVRRQADVGRLDPDCRSPPIVVARPTGQGCGYDIASRNSRGPAGTLAAPAAAEPPAFDRARIRVMAPEVLTRKVFGEVGRIMYLRAFQVPEAGGRPNRPAHQAGAFPAQPLHPLPVANS